jgi:type I restriction enzyme S subunit
MKNKTKQQNKIPKLRFPEFSGEWKEKRLGEIANFLKGKGISKNDIVEDGKNKCIRYGELYTEYNEVVNVVKSRTNISKKDVILSKKNDILMPISDVTPNGLATASALDESGVILGGDILIIRSDKILNRFFSYYVAGNKKDIMRLVSGVTVYHIYGSDLATLKIFLPSLSEQQKIASFLSAVDERIGVLQKKREGLEKYKKGIMQKIFPAKGEKVPQIRFKDDNGKDFPEWEEKRIEDIFKITRGYVLSTKEMSKEKTGEYKYPVYSSQTQRNGLIGYYKEYLYKNAITWTTDGANAGEVKYRDGKFYCTNVCGVLLNNEGYANQCIAEMLNLVTRKYVSYVGNPKLMNNVMAKIKIKLPSLPEQQKVASFLSAIDKKIELIDAQIQKMQEWKRGLMQGLFV